MMKYMFLLFSTLNLVFLSLADEATLQEFKAGTNLFAADVYRSCEPLVTIDSGMIRGRVTTTPNNTTFFAFQDIPYAAPPTGNFRFQPPQPVPHWSGVMDTTQNTKFCYQVSSNLPLETEDCLILNVYTPQLPCSTSDGFKLLPVLFFIHGGGFIDGNAAFVTFGPDFLIEQELVVVTIHYRLGLFGFISTGDDAIPGNNGLRDQQFAMKWVQRNIRKFGGDPSKVTIAGQSAGSASVAYQLLNSNSKGLFRGAILESGSAICPWAYQRNPRYYAFQTALAIDPTFNLSASTKQLRDFLLNASSTQLDTASGVVTSMEQPNNTQMFQGFFYAPVIERNRKTGFVVDFMFETIKSGKALKVPILMGMNSEEAIAPWTTADSVKLAMSVFDSNPEYLVPNDMNVRQNKNFVGRQIRRLYVGNGQFQDNPGLSVRFLSDTIFNRPIVKHGFLQKTYSDVYFYQFSYAGPMGFVEVLKEKETEGNFLVSPFSVQTVLALTQSGARNLTAQELRTALRLPNTRESVEATYRELLPTIQSTDLYNLSSANKIYVKTGYAIRDEYRKIAADIYGAGVEDVDFSKKVEAANSINQWVEERTNEKIQNLIDPTSLDETTRLVLVNTLYFNGKWVKPFEGYATIKRNFYKSTNPKDAVQVETMHNVDVYNYYECDKLKAKFLELFYEGDDVSMVFVLPNEQDGLAELERQIDRVFVAPVFEQRRVSVYIPRFAIETKIKFNEILKILGARAIFSENADLSGIAGEPGDLVVSDVVQKTFINVTETGTEAAAATAVQVVRYSEVTFSEIFSADHPFVFYIKAKNVVILEGRYTAPIWHVERIGISDDPLNTFVADHPFLFYINLNKYKFFVGRYVSPRKDS